MTVFSKFLIVATVAATAGADTVKDAFARMYNFDFAGAHRHIDQHIQQHPQDPMGPAMRASAYLFSELDRLRILEGEFFIDDKKISADGELTPDPKIREKFFAAMAEAQKLAEVRVKADPNDTIALFCFSMTEGLRTDYMAFIERKQLRSLSSAKKAQLYAVELLKKDPTFADAYLTKGITEYLAGSLPFFIRWIIRFEETQGSKQIAVSNLEKVIREGRYFGPFAKILLSIIHLREKRPKQALTLLEELARDYPENPLLKKELAALRTKMKTGGRASE